MPQISLAHGWTCGDGHGRFPAAGGGLAARQGGAGSCGMLSACGWWRLKVKELLALPKKALLRWVHAGETRFCGRPCSVLCEK